MYHPTGEPDMNDPNGESQPDQTDGLDFEEVDVLPPEEPALVPQAEVEEAPSATNTAKAKQAIDQIVEFLNRLIDLDTLRSWVEELRTDENLTNYDLACQIIEAGKRTDFEKSTKARASRFIPVVGKTVSNAWGAVERGKHQYESLSNHMQVLAAICLVYEPQTSHARELMVPFAVAVGRLVDPEEAGALSLQERSGQQVINSSARIMGKLAKGFGTEAAKNLGLSLVGNIPVVGGLSSKFAQQKLSGSPKFQMPSMSEVFSANQMMSLVDAFEEIYPSPRPEVDYGEEDQEPDSETVSDNPFDLLPTSDVTFGSLFPTTLFTGWLGAHCLFLGKPIRGLIYLITLGGYIVCWLGDLFRLIRGELLDHAGKRVVPPTVEESTGLAQKIMVWDQEHPQLGNVMISIVDGIDGFFEGLRNTVKKG